MATVKNKLPLKDILAAIDMNAKKMVKKRIKQEEKDAERKFKSESK